MWECAGISTGKIENQKSEKILNTLGVKLAKHGTLYIVNSKTNASLEFIWKTMCF